MTQRIRAVYSRDQLAGFLRRNELTLTTGADILGIGRRALNDYLQGHAAIPATVARLCWALDRLQELNGGQVDIYGFKEPWPDRDYAEGT